MIVEQRASRLRRAFPSAIAAAVDEALLIVPEGSVSDDDIGPARVGGQTLAIPRRIYSPEPSARTVDALGSTAGVVLACWYTRHSDGRVRERNLRKIICSPADYVPPFVVQLLGEYVVEIHRDIESNIECLRQPSYRQFVADNAAFLELTRQRVMSYWDCYFRSATSNIEAHAAFRVLRALTGYQSESAAPSASGQSRIAN